MKVVKTDKVEVGKKRTKVSTYQRGYAYSIVSVRYPPLCGGYLQRDNGLRPITCGISTYTTSDLSIFNEGIWPQALCVWAASTSEGCHGDTHTPWYNIDPTVPADEKVYEQLGLISCLGNAKFVWTPESVNREVPLCMSSCRVLSVRKMKKWRKCILHR